VEVEGPVPEPEEARDEGATTVAKMPVMEPVAMVTERPEGSAPRPTEARGDGTAMVAVEPVVMLAAELAAVVARPEGSGLVASNTALGEASSSSQIAAASSGGLAASPSGSPDGGVS